VDGLVSITARFPDKHGKQHFGTVQAGESLQPPPTIQSFVIFNFLPVNLSQWIASMSARRVMVRFEMLQETLEVTTSPAARDFHS